MPKKYIDDNGFIVEVCQGLGVKFIVARRTPGGCSHHAVKTKILPPRLSMEAAQLDLDGYAEAKKWKVFDEA